MSFEKYEKNSEKLVWHFFTQFTVLAVPQNYLYNELPVIIWLTSYHTVNTQISISFEKYNIFEETARNITFPLTADRLSQYNGSTDEKTYQCTEHIFTNISIVIPEIYLYLFTYKTHKYLYKNKRNKLHYAANYSFCMVLWQCIGLTGVI